MTLTVERSLKTCFWNVVKLLVWGTPPGQRAEQPTCWNPGPEACGLCEAPSLWGSLLATSPLGFGAQVYSLYAAGLCKVASEPCWHPALRGNLWGLTCPPPNAISDLLEG